jgi:cytochrome c553
MSLRLIRRPGQTGAESRRTLVKKFAHRSMLMGAAVLLAVPLMAPADPASATRGAQRVDACSHCHGRSGEGLAVSGFPRLAGQPAAYLAKQLHDFAAGSRRHAVMQYFARSMSGQDIADIAAYYAAFKAPPARPEPEQADAAAGRKLAESGDARLGVAACDSCHGPGGRGQPPLLPYLAGQNANYIAGQLQAWQSGSRNNDAGGQMKAVAAKLSAADTAALAGYFENLPPPQ